MNSILRKSIFWGVLGGVLLLVFYFIILTLANSFSHALEQLRLLWFGILALVLGFSFQIGLYSYVRLKFKQRQIKAGPSKEMAASTGISTFSMVACCGHHLVNFLPILGLSAVFLFLARYQIFFILLGLATNLIGIILMLEIIKKHSLFPANGILSRLAKFNMKKIRNGAVISLILLLLVSLFLIKNNTQGSQVTAKISQDVLNNNQSSLNSNMSSSLPTRINDEAGLIIEVAPINFSIGQPVQFSVALNTHQGALDFDLTKQSVLFDDQGKQYLPLEWQGGQGGHHLSGTLIFPPLKNEVKQFKFIIKNIYNVGERIFEWNLE